MTGVDGQPRTYVEGPEPRWPLCNVCQKLACPGTRCGAGDGGAFICPFAQHDAAGEPCLRGGILEPPT